MERLGGRRAFVVGTVLIASIWANEGQAQPCSALPPWGSASPMAAAALGQAATTDGVFIYAASGSTAFPGGGDVNAFQRYDPVANTWTLLANVPTAVTGGILAYDAVGGPNGPRLFLFGGVDASLTVLAIVQVYTIATNSWAPGPALPDPRFAMGGGVIEGSIYLVGGISSINPYLVEDENWEFDPGTGMYTNRATLPVAKGRPGSAVSGGRLYVIGGEDDSPGLVDTNYEYSPLTNTWATRAPIPVAVNKPGGTALSAMTANCNGDILIVGGGTPYSPEQVLPGRASRAAESTNIAQVYDVATNSWSPGPSLDTARFAMQAVQVGNTLIAFGGWDGSSAVATVDRIQGPPLPVKLESFYVE